jgi:hypothetical protein
MTTVTLSEQEVLATGYTHRVTLTFSDLISTSGDSKTIKIWPGSGTNTAHVGAAQGIVYVKTQFAGSDNAAVTIEVGDANDPNRFVDQVSLLSSSGTWLSGVTLATAPYIFTTADTVDIKVATTSGKSLSTLTAGEVLVFIRLIDLTKAIA